jgi:hypothetical protein
MMKTKALLLTSILLAMWLVCIGRASAEEKLSLQYARGFEVEPCAGGRLVTIHPTWNEGGPAFRYLLVPRGHAVPKEHPPA